MLRVCLIIPQSSKPILIFLQKENWIIINWIQEYLNFIEIVNKQATAASITAPLVSQLDLLQHNLLEILIKYVYLLQ